MTPPGSPHSKKLAPSTRKKEEHSTIRQGPDCIPRLSSRFGTLPVPKQNRFLHPQSPSEPHRNNHWPPRSQPSASSTLYPDMHPAERPDSADPIRARTTLGDFELTISPTASTSSTAAPCSASSPNPSGKRAPADDQNRILLGLNTVIVRTGQHTIAIETGIGNKLPPKLNEIYGATSSYCPHLRGRRRSAPKKSTSSSTPTSTSTTAAGTPPALPTAASSPPSPTLATSPIAAKSHTATCNSSATPSATSPTTTIPSSPSGQMTLLDTAAPARSEIVPGISVECFPGHTAQTPSAIHIESAGQRTPATSPTSSPPRPPRHHLGHGLRPRPRRLHRRAQALLLARHPRDWLVLFTHDHHTPLARIALNEKGKPVLV